MITKFFNQLRCFYILLFLALTSCASQKTLLIDSVTPIISIDSVFTSVKIKNGAAHAKRLTDATSKLLDSAAKDGAFVYIPNYKSEFKKPSTYTFSAILSPSKLLGDTSKSLVPSFRASLFDNLPKVMHNDLAIYGANSKDTRVLMYNASLPDSTDYKELSFLMSFSSRLQYLVPFKSLLLPIKQNDNSLKSFSIDKIITSSKENQMIAHQLTHLANNILVYNQLNYPKNIFKEYRNYTYHPNYLHKRKKFKKKSDFQIHAVLTEDADSFVVDFKLYGKDVNLVMMEDAGISTKIILSKKRLLEKDYSEAMLQMHMVIPSFIVYQTIFEN